MMKKWIVLFILLSLATGAMGLDVSGWEKAFIFNVPSILLEIQEYQGGLGLKTGPGEWFVRGMLDFGWENDGQPPAVFHWGIGATWEKPLIRAKASPYFGAAAGIHFYSEHTEIAGGDWSRDEIFSIELGPLLGIELEIIEGVSLFAEYQLLARLGWTATITYVAGQTTRVSGEPQWLLNLNLGNSGLIGLCIYFKLPAD